MMKKYNFKSVEEMDSNLVSYVETVANQSITELTMDEINEFLNEVDEFLEDEWPWQDSGIECGF